MADEHRVLIPDELYSVIEFNQDELPGIGVINGALLEFEPKIVFSWHLSIMIHFNDLVDNGMPSVIDRTKAEEWEDEISPTIIGDSEHPNALRLGRITWNKTREILFRVYDPEPANQFLQKLIEFETYPLPIDYRIDPDEEWRLAKWHLNAVAGVGGNE